MKRDLRRLVVEIGRKMRQEPRHLASDFERVSHALSQRHVNLSSDSLRKLWEILRGQRKLSPQTLDRLALFAGFQDWADLHNALRGEVDASVNYEDR